MAVPGRLSALGRAMSWMERSARDLASRLAGAVSRGWPPGSSLARPAILRFSRLALRRALLSVPFRAWRASSPASLLGLRELSWQDRRLRFEGMRAATAVDACRRKRAPPRALAEVAAALGVGLGVPSLSGERLLHLQAGPRTALTLAVLRMWQDWVFIWRPRRRVLYLATTPLAVPPMLLRLIWSFLGPRAPAAWELRCRD